VTANARKSERFLAIGESVIADATFGTATGVRGSQLVRVMLTDRGRLVGFKADTGRPLFSANLDEVATFTSSVKHPFSGLGAPLVRIQLFLRDGSAIGLQAHGIGARRAKALATALRERLTRQGE